MALKENIKAPEFKLTDKAGKKYSLKDFKSDFYVVYFYPKDDTLGCTLEAKDFSKKINNFEKENIKIIGISGGDDKSKEKFCNKYNLKILLLSDSDFKISKKYNVYGKKSFMGHVFNGISRVTYVLDKKKKIIKVFSKVKPLGHANEVLEYIQSIKN